MHNISKKYLRFSYQFTTYEFQCLPFGLCIAPFIFTKLFKLILSLLRCYNISCINYLDDLLIIAQTKEQCKRDVMKTGNLLANLGFLINNDKSQLGPAQTCTFLGFVYDTRSSSVSLRGKNINKILTCLRNFKSKLSYNIKELAKLTGMLLSACQSMDGHT